MLPPLPETSIGALPENAVVQPLAVPPDPFQAPADALQLPRAQSVAERPRSTGLRGTAALVVDASGLLVASVVAAAAIVVDGPDPVARFWQAFPMTFVRLVVCVPALIAVLATTRRPEGSVLRPSLTDQLQNVALPLGAGGMAALALWRALGSLTGLHGPSLDGVLVLCAAAVTLVSLARLAYHSPRRTGVARRVLMVGSGEVADRVSAQLGATAGVEVIGFVDDDPKEPTGQLGTLGDLAAVCEREQVDHVVVAFSNAATTEMIEVLRPVQTQLPITVVPRLFDLLPPTAHVQEVAPGFPGISVAPATLDGFQHGLKRLTDLVGATVGLALLSPVLVVVALAIRLTTPGPVLLRQARVGRNGEVFPMLKFRTMRVRRPEDESVAVIGEPVKGPFPKLKRDPRVTPVGRVLRRLSLDELPQLFNVVSGKMSLVGPRPFVIDDAASIGGWALRRYSMRPGITGLWQVSGRNDLTYEEMCRLDHLYVSCWSLGLDARILVRTARAVAAGRGAY
ncbi:MAG TPA: sugar transferase [Acidimicrobiales bacterium]|nr:sugar transferase [Acidimicrobiales bacterium]